MLVSALVLAMVATPVSAAETTESWETEGTSAGAKDAYHDAGVYVTDNPSDPSASHAYQLWAEADVRSNLDFQDGDGKKTETVTVTLYSQQYESGIGYYWVKEDEHQVHWAEDDPGTTGKVYGSAKNVYSGTGTFKVETETCWQYGSAYPNTDYACNDETYTFSV